MLVYLSKRIAIPNNVKLNCISWNKDQGWISCGGDSGLLKVLKLETATDVKDPGAKGVSAPSNLSMNQTLEGHTGGVMCTTWNPLFRKLTTSDESGLIIVWMLHKGSWFEEMVNNRNKSVVRDMKWTADGKKICIVYEDGAVIVGSVDGNRLWGKELNMPLKFVEWSPDGRLIIFVTSDSEVWVYDSEGTRIRSVPLTSLDPEGSGDIPLVGIHWHYQEGTSRVSTGGPLHYSHPDNAPSLCLAMRNGMILLCRGDEDTNPVVIDADMKITSCKWDHSGNVLAITGSVKDSGKSKNSSKDEDGSKMGTNQIKFYDPYGKLLRITKIPGDNIAGICWEGTGLRLALAVDTFIFFANIRPVYTWTYLANSIVYAFSKSDKRDSNLVFWDLTTGEAFLKVVNGLKFLASSGDYCAVLLAERNKKDPKDKEITYTIQLRNSIGAIVDCKTVPFAPKYVSMGSYHIVCANDRTVYTWQFQSLVSKSSLTSSASDNNLDNMDKTSKMSMKSKERIFDVQSSELTPAQSPETFKIQYDIIPDPVVSITVDEKFLVIGRKNGVIVRYTLPHLTQENTYNSGVEPFRMELNCISSRLAIIDSNGVLSVLDLEAKIIEGEEKSNNNVGQSCGKRMNIDKKDVWDVKWAEDNDEMLCIMEKTKLIIYRGEVAEDPIVSSGYIARFKDLEVKSVLLDELMVKPDQPNKECVVDYESKSLREVREKITVEGLQGGYLYAEKSPHPRLYKLIAQSALEVLDLNMAEKSFVKSNDYYGIQLVKQLSAMPDKIKARAEVAVYLKRFDEAENIYREIDRRDLALDMRRKIGDDTRVVHLLQTYGGGNDQLVRDAWNRIGEYYADRFKWKKAVQYFQQSRDIDRLVECYYRLEDFNNLAKLRLDIADGSPLLVSLASRFESVGMYEEAVDCHLRSNNPKAAVDCCIALNRWDKALELAEAHDFPQVEGLLQRYASKLVSNDRYLEAVELYRRANKPTEAALLIGEVADIAARKDVKPSLAKKLHVLAAFEVERHRKRTMDLATQAITVGGTIAQTTAATLETLMMTNLDTQTGAGVTLGTTTVGKKASKAFGNAWRGAAAYHFYMLAHRQLYAGNTDAAMRTSIKLCEYDDIIEPRAVYSLLCISSLRAKFYGVCSKAFVKLETLSNGITDAIRDEIQTLAVHIFVQHSPVDPAPLPEVYMKCLELGKSFKACVVTGRAIQESASFMCKTCRHSMLEAEKGNLVNCPLCHSSLNATESNTKNIDKLGGSSLASVMAI